jgi:pimeloyl-ACP methyl ester carboxylesterase
MCAPPDKELAEPVVGWASMIPGRTASAAPRMNRTDHLAAPRTHGVHGRLAFLEHGDNLALLLRASLDYPFPQSQTGYVRQLEALMGMDARPWLEQIDTACLVVAAEHDALLPPEESARLAVPGADYVVVAGSGHCAPVERPMLCSSLVLGHLARAGARATTQADDRFSP